MSNIKNIQRDIKTYIQFLNCCRLVNWLSFGLFNKWNNKSHFIEKTGEIFFNKKMKNW